MDLLKEKYEITEERGILTLDFIKGTIKKVCEKTDYKDKVEYIYLFGSYAKGYQEGKSDVDLAYSGNIEGINYFGLIKDLRVSLHKRVDLLNLKDCCVDFDVLNEILKDGIKIYVREKEEGW